MLANVPMWSEAAQIGLLSDIGYWYAGAAVLGVNTWVWSTVFHTRDVPWTEKMDYFSAAAGILYSVVYSIIRIARINSARGRVLLLLLALST